MSRLFIILLLLYCTVMNSVAQPKQAGTAERLIAEADYALDNQSQFVMTDSLRFWYSGTRGSSFDCNEFLYLNPSDFDNPAAVTYPGTAPSLLFAEPAANNIDSSTLPHVFYDSLLHYYYDASSGSMRYLRHSQGNTFNVNNTFSALTSHTYNAAGAATAHHREIAGYNAAGNISTVTALSYSRNRWDTAYIRNISYSSSGAVSEDSLTISPAAGGSYYCASHTFYTTNAAGQYTVRWQRCGARYAYADIARTTYSYDGAGRVRTIASESTPFVGAALYIAERDSFIYLPGMAGYKDKYAFEFMPNGDTGISRKALTNRITAAGQKDSVTTWSRFAGDLWITESGFKLHYDAAGNPTQLTETYLTSQPYVAGYHNYYYEPVSPVSVAPLSAPAIAVSPNPVLNDVLTLHYLQSLGTVSIIITITDAVGRLVQTERLAANGGSVNILLGAGVVPGVYSIAVYKADKSLLYRGSFLKK